jgi:hypothetical protein
MRGPILNVKNARLAEEIARVQSRESRSAAAVRLIATPLAYYPEIAATT